MDYENHRKNREKINYEIQRHSERLANLSLDDLHDDFKSAQRGYIYGGGTVRDSILLIRKALQGGLDHGDKARSYEIKRREGPGF